MSYNRIGSCKFYMDAALLARQWGMIETENPEKKYYLNPSKITSISLANTDSYLNLIFKNRYWCNSISHCFVLGHSFYTDEVEIKILFADAVVGGEDTEYHEPFGENAVSLEENGWTKYEFANEPRHELIRATFYLVSTGNLELPDTRLGDLSFGWSYEMEHSSDLELTQSFSNESIKTQTTKGGHTLTSAGWNHQPGWIQNAWAKNTLAATKFEHENFKVFPSGRRSWNLKFSYLADSTASSETYLSDSGLFAPKLNSSVGIFEDLGGGTRFSIKQDFMSRVFYGSNCFQLPFIFTPDANATRVNSSGDTITDPEYAICRIDSDTASFEQVANNVYNISLDIVEVW